MAEDAGRPGLFADPHRRYDPLRDEWVLVSPGRTNRPWQGGEERPQVERRPAFDPACYLCPGNTRANGEPNPGYASTYVFTNDFAALRPTTSDDVFEDGLLRAEGERGTSRVICFSPRHDLTLAGMATSDVRSVVDLWASQTEELGARYPWVQVFENRGEAMGASNSHPHGQVWAGTALPTGPAREDAAQRAYRARTGGSLLLDVARQEADGPRVVDQDDDWLVIVPFWAVWPFEVLVLPRQPVARLPQLDDTRRDGLAAILGRVLRRYDALFGVPFPYSMGWHQAPFTADADLDAWQLHAHAYPPLLRSASVRKFMVGYELLAEAQRDLTPEDAAARLRDLDPGA
ncbi:MAG: UDP-glucose--hexose-1-phosphate uridylyltransferase [Candidatus Limnocylindrales bacterium]